MFVRMCVYVRAYVCLCLCVFMSVLMCVYVCGYVCLCYLFMSVYFFCFGQGARNTNGLESWGSCNNLKDRSDVVFECVEEKIRKDDKMPNRIKKDVDVHLSVTFTAVNELQKVVFSISF